MDRAATPGWDGGKKAAKAFLEERGELLSELQERLFAHGRTGGSRAVLLVVQGLDTAGKGGIVRHVIGMVDPQGVALRAFGVPTEGERRHHYLWRVRRSLPTAGMIGVFDRSHYEDVLVPRVETGEDIDVQRRYDEINRFERQVALGGTTIVKMALMPSYEEQGLRLMERLDRPDKWWKWNPGDVDTRRKWDAYQEAYADLLTHTHTDAAPWHVVPADRKWYARLAVTELLTQALVDLDLSWPRPRWRVETQKRRLAATMSEASLAEAEQVAREKADRHRASEQAYEAAVTRIDDGVPSPSLTARAEGAGGKGMAARPAEPTNGQSRKSDKKGAGTTRDSTKKAGKKNVGKNNVAKKKKNVGKKKAAKK